MRRRKPRVVWLPPTNANSLGAAATSGIQIFSLDVAGTTGDFVVANIPLVIDGQGDELAPENTLSDIENSGYRLRRVVGKVFCQQRQQLGQLDPGQAPFQVLVTAGLIVRRVNQVTGLPLVAFDASGALSAPQEIRNFGDPWIWRRSWLLNDNSIEGSTEQLPVGPMTNFGNSYGSVADGPHVDQKTARIVSQEERLFLCMQSTIIEPGSLPDVTASTLVLTDLRVLGSMRTSSGNRRNASR